MSDWGKSDGMKAIPQRLCLRAVLRSTLGLVGSWTPGQTKNHNREPIREESDAASYRPSPSVRGVVPCDVADAVTAWGGALDQLLAVFAPPVNPTKGHVACLSSEKTLRG